MATDERANQTHEEWWADLSLEERYLAIETIRLDQDPDHAPGRRPTGERAEWVRRRPEYAERFAGADHIAHQDQTCLGPDIVPASHAHTQPLDQGADQHADEGPAIGPGGA